MARALLLQFPLLERITLEVVKPWAPVGLPLEAVSVQIVREWHSAYIAVGANLGEREVSIRNGIKALREHPDCVVEQESKLIVTEPYGGVEQPDFLNGVLKVRTLLSPLELLELLHQIEQQAGRQRDIRWGPRTLDLDIIFYDDWIVDLESLEIPHKDMQNRKFVLEPLAKLAPFYRHPLTKKTVQQMLEELK